MLFHILWLSNIPLYVCTTSSLSIHQYSCLKNAMDRGAWQATVQRVAELDMTPHTTPTRDIFIHSSVDGHLGYFHVLAIVNVLQ